MMLVERPRLAAVPSAPNPTPNCIGHGTSVRGDLRGEGGFRIDGTVDGSVEAQGPVTVGENGSVSGLVRGTHITIEGTVNGDVFATGHLEVGPHGRLVGDATAKSVRVADGGVFRGMSRMGGEGDEAVDSRPSTNLDQSGERWAATDSEPPEEILTSELRTSD